MVITRQLACIISSTVAPDRSASASSVSPVRTVAGAHPGGIRPHAGRTPTAVCGSGVRVAAGVMVGVSVAVGIGTIEDGVCVVVEAPAMAWVGVEGPICSVSSS